MHKKRRKAHRNLINALLNCNEGEEWELLQAHPELIDLHFIQVMQKVAEELEKKGDEKGADFLWDLSDALVSVAVYQGIIEQLLNCASDEEAWQILDANRDWVDAGFQQTMLEVAEDLRTQGDLDNANFLMNLAEELMGVHGNTSDAQLNFLMQVLQATAESGGDAQKVNPLLSANIDKLDDRLAEQLQALATNKLAEAKPDEAEYIAADIGNFSNLIQEFPLGKKASNMEIAITGYEIALKVFTRDAFLEDWAGTQNNLGLAFSDRIRGDKAENLDVAIACFQQALKVYTLDAFPVDWARTQYSLGNAYLERIRGERAENLDTAIACYQDALTVTTLDAFPVDWATTQNNLAAAYSDRIRGERAENLEMAIACYQDALTVRTLNAFPVDWASTQNNLGNAYSNRIRGERTENLEMAIACFQHALKVRIFEAFPQNHAETLSNLGTVYKEAKQFDLAYTTFESAIATVESLREEIVSGEESKRKQAEHFNQAYSRMVEVCLKLSNITEAIEYIERSKTRNLVEQILNRDLKTIFPLEVVTQLEQYRDEIAIGQYQIQNGKAENPKVLKQNLQELRQKQNELQDHYLPIGSGFEFDHFQNNLDDHTAIVEFYIAGNKLLTFIFTRQTQKPIVWQSHAKDLDKLVKWVNGYFRAYDTKSYHWQYRLTTRLHLLTKILHIDEIIQQIPPECERLILIPHEVLHLFPLHALPINSQQGNAKSEILMHRFPAGVSYAPSCQLLQLAQTRQRPDFNHLFAIQNPTEDLDYANIEVETIKSNFKTADVLVKKASTKAAIDSKHLNTFHCAHFSCHGYFNLNQPQKSALILADAHKPAPAEPNPELYLPLSDNEVLDLNKCLTLDAVFALKLEQCRLVTLSACETGLIDYTNISDEYIGLPSGFLVAGSPAVVSSLWTVNDLSTAFLMIKFYENLRKQMSLVLALNQAQFWLRDATKEELQRWIEKLPLNFVQKYVIQARFHKLSLKDKPFEEPFHWAAFCAIGQ